MRFSSIRGKGLGVSFPHEFAVDLDAIPGPLVAITGENGAGKSTFLELLGGSMYRVCPTRGSLADLATGRDSFLETVVVNGARHHIRHVMDSVSGKGESVVTDSDGIPLVTSAKMREFDAWAAKHLPPREVFYASMFAAQKSAGFIGMKPAERKAVLLRVLGIEHLETLAKKAREHVAESKAAANAIETRIADERARATDPKSIEAAVAALVAERAGLEGAVTLARAKLDEATAAEQLARIARQDIDAHVARRNELVARLQGATAKAEDVKRRLANNQGVLARSAEIRDAIAKDTDLVTRIEALAVAVNAGRTTLTAAENDLAVVQDEVVSLKKRHSDAVSREARATQRLADRVAVEAAAETVTALRRQVEVLEGEVSQIETEIRERQDLILNSATTRIGGLRTGLEAIATPGSLGVTIIARDALAQDDETAAKSAEAPALVGALQSRIASAKSELAAKRRALQDADRLAARATEMANAAAEAADAAGEAASLRTPLEAAQAILPTRHESVKAAREACAKAESEHRDGVAAREVLAPLVKLAEPLTQAEVRVAELEPQATTHAEDVARLTKDLGALGDLPGDVELPDLEGARNALEKARTDVSANHSAVAVQESKLAAAVEAAKHLEAMKTKLAAATDEVSDWTRLADDLGRDGLQALEIDAAGPELTALVNDLLHTCVGPRWTVSIQASRLSADGKKVLEGCEVSVLDTVKGREGEAETLSGGEGAIVGEAVSLALAMVSCRRSGVKEPTLVRDETGAALDSKNASAYIAMLRRACELVGASRCFYVSHNPEIQALADARIAIADGKITVS